MRPASPPPSQQPLALDLPEELVMQKAEEMRLRRAYWWRRYRTLDALLADPTRAHVFLTCARNELRVQLARAKT